MKKDVQNFTRNIKGLFTGEHDAAESEELVDNDGDVEMNRRNKLRKRKSKTPGGAFYLGGRPSYLEVNDNDDEDGQEDEREEAEEIQDEYSVSHPKGVFSPIPSPSKMTVNPLFAKTHPSQAATVAAPRSYKQRVVTFYQRYNPSKMDALPEILQRYQGREEELLKKLHKQYNIAYVSSSSESTVDIAANV